LNSDDPWNCPRMTTCGAESSAALRVPAPALVLHVTTQIDQVAPTRRAVHEYLVTHAVPARVADDVRLVASELITNAIVHGGPATTVDVELAVRPPAEVVLQVSNDGSAGRIPPIEEWRPAPAHAPNGRGLGIVRRLCDAVEVRGDERVATVVCRRRWQSGGEA
jgi:anti-sigma regulatory factor (Ser/Thr protein kinase)